MATTDTIVNQFTFNVYFVFYVQIFEAFVRLGHFNWHFRIIGLVLSINRSRFGLTALGGVCGFTH